MRSPSKVALTESSVTLAIVREPGKSFSKALSTHPEKNSIDGSKALAQHRGYVAALRRAGLDIVSLDPMEDFPDGPFVEDTAIVAGDRAWLCSMGADSRRGEAESVSTALRRYRKVEPIPPPAFVDGGDVLNIDGALYVGQSSRTNPAALTFLEKNYAGPFRPVAVKGGLHLKSSVSYLGRGILLIAPDKVDVEPFGKFEWIEAAPDESANCLTLGDRVIFPEGYPRLAEEIRRCGFNVDAVDIGEFEKADAGVTCLSIIL